MSYYSVTAIPCLKDNYAWVLQDDKMDAVVVDPGEYAPIALYLDKNGLTLQSILITHGHRDHVDGVAELLRKYPSCRIWGPSAVKGVTNPVAEGSTISLFHGELALSTWHCPGHTREHVIFLGNELVFCGDALFSGGCGRVLDGTVEELFSTVERINSLPGNTKLYCGHEYTLSNLSFALTIIPEDKAIKDYLEVILKKRANNESSLPTTLNQERAINVFLRTSDKRVLEALRRFGTGAEELDRLTTFALLRSLKDSS